MAAITPTTTVNASTMSANWKTYTGQSGSKWLAKYLAPRVAFNSDPNAWQASWFAGVQAANTAGTPARNFGAADVLTKAANNAATFGQANFVSAATNKAGNYAAVAPALASALSAARAQVEAMPKATVAERQQRMIAWSNAMHNYKGKIKNA